MRFAAVLLANAAGSLAQLVPQFSALVLLGAADFGRFSILYLVFAWGLSLQMSIVCEPSARQRVQRGSEVSRPDYLATSSAVALVTAVCAAGVGALVWDGATPVVLGAVAVLVATSRGAMRYLDVMSDGWTGAVAGDLAFLAAFFAALAGSWSLLDDPTGALLAAWLLAGTAALVVGSTPRPPVVRRVSGWFLGHRDAIGPLLKESLILDASSIGAPFLLTPLLSLREFGLYRAVSNVAAPVRLVLEPLRPQAGRVRGTQVRRRMLLWVPVVGAVLGACATLAVAAVDRLALDLGVLAELGPYSLVVGGFVWGSFVSTAFYYVARVHATPAQLLRGRLVQSGTALALPLVGALLWGLDAAMGGYVLATAIGAVTWAVLWTPGEPSAAQDSSAPLT